MTLEDKLVRLFEIQSERMDLISRRLDSQQRQIDLLTQLASDSRITNEDRRLLREISKALVTRPAALYQYNGWEPLKAAIRAHEKRFDLKETMP